MEIKLSSISPSKTWINTRHIMTISTYLRTLLDSIIKNVKLTLNAFKTKGKALIYALPSIGKDSIHFLITYRY